jgi:hypothetical protein
VAVVLPSQGLALPTPSLIPHGRATAPVGVGSSRREPRGDLVPSPRGGGSLQLEGLGDDLTGHRPLQGQESRVSRGRRPGRSGLPRTGVALVLGRQDGRHGCGHERGRSEGLESTRRLGVNRVPAMDRRVPLAPACHLPAPAVQVGTR